MQLMIISLIQTNKCRHTLSSPCVRIVAIVCRYIHSPWYLQTQAGIWHDQLYACWCVLILRQMHTHADTRKQPSIHENIWRYQHCESIHANIWQYQHCSECTPTNPDTCSALDTRKTLQLHAQLSKRENTPNTLSALDTGQHMRNHDWILMSAEIWRFTLIFWYWPTHDGLHPAPNMNQHIQLHAKDSIHAGTCVLLALANT